MFLAANMISLRLPICFPMLTIDPRRGASLEEHCGIDLNMMQSTIRTFPAIHMAIVKTCLLVHAQLQGHGLLSQ